MTALQANAGNAPPQRALKRVRALHKRGKYSEARLLCDKLERQGYSSPGLLHLHGLALRGCEDAVGAIDKLAAAHQQDPSDVSILNSMGVVFLGQGKPETAIDLFKSATRIDQKHYDSWYNLGIALKAAERLQAAELAFTCAHHLDRTKLEPLLNLVDILIDAGLYGQAMEFTEKLGTEGHAGSPKLHLKQLLVAARLQDFDLIEARYAEIDRAGLTLDEEAQLENVWAYCLEVRGNYEAAINVLETWAARPTAHRHQLQSQLGVLYSKSGRISKALDCHLKLLEESPDHVAGRYNLALLQFRTGEVGSGYENYEARWQWREFPSKRRIFDMPQWSGEPVSNKRVLVWREQGIGDEVRFASLIPELHALGANVIFESSPKLMPLMQSCFPWSDIREEGPVDCRGEAGYESFDYHVPVGSLGAFFRNDVKKFAKKQRPWIPRDIKAEERVRQCIGSAKGKLVVGLCWRSANQATSRNQYFFDIAQLEPLKELADASWLNLQYDSTQAELDAARSAGLELHHFGDVNQKDDLVTACHLMGACDIIITIGGAVGDLSGGLGVPTLYITRQKSEIFLGTDHVPWFPAARAFPMKPGGGDEIISSIIETWAGAVEWAGSINGDRWRYGLSEDEADFKATRGSLDLMLGETGA